MRLGAGVLLSAYFAVLAGLCLLGLHRLYLSAVFLARDRGRPPVRDPLTLATGSRETPAGRDRGRPSPVPRVTVQLPVFNEIFVLDRLVEAACALRHPRGLLEIQILDDSTDATAARAAALAKKWSERGLDVVHLHRSTRSGYKAGALAAGLSIARGDLVAVFDADFVPPPDFLERTLPPFADPRVGMVQARWGHLNGSRSALTRAQALMLDAHFGVEQAARAASGRFFNFNGTAGVFRRRCIEEAGGWQADTLTEDLDLSYRAQIAGWRFVYLDDVVCPAELPEDVNALRSQQHRWAKGSMQTARKIVPRLLRSRLPASVKIAGVLHLLDNAAYLLLFAASLLVIPSLAVRLHLGSRTAPADLAVFLAGTCSFGIYAAVSRRGRAGRALRGLADLPAAMALGAGLALNNALAVLEALLGRSSEFRRTPKLGRLDERQSARGGAPPGPPGFSSPAGAGLDGDPTRSSRGGFDDEGDGPLCVDRGAVVTDSYRSDPTRLAPIELVLSLGFVASIVWAWGEGLYTSIPFLALFGAGYGYVSLLTLARERVPRPGAWLLRGGTAAAGRP